MKSKHSFLILVILVLLYQTASAQTPGGINYQGVARNQFLVGLNNDSIQLRFTVKEKTANGAVLYTETRGTRTDSFGVFNVVIGAAGAISQSGNIKLVPWSDTTKKFLMVEMNILDPNTPGFLNMGTTQLLSVPFSFYSDISDSARIAAKADSAKFSNGSGRYFFSATIEPMGTQALPPGDDETFNITMKFPVINMNEGNHYNPTTSEFTAPDSGIYQFDVTLYEEIVDYNSTDPENTNVDVLFAITKNGKVVKMLGEFSYYHSGSTYDENTSIKPGSVKLKLKAGDKVAVKVANGTSSGTAAISLDLDAEDLEYLNANYEMTAFAEFSGYKIK